MPITLAPTQSFYYFVQLSRVLCSPECWATPLLLTWWLMPVFVSKGIFSLDLQLVATYLLTLKEHYKTYAPSGPRPPTGAFDSPFTTPTSGGRFGALAREEVSSFNLWRLLTSCAIYPGSSCEFRAFFYILHTISLVSQFTDSISGLIFTFHWAFHRLYVC